MGSHPSSDLRVAIEAFRRIVQELRTSSREAERRVGLSAAQLFALQQLASSPGTSVNDLAARTFTHQSSVSAVVARLVERRLVAKVTSPEDRRRLRLAVTDAGRAVLRRSPEPIQERLIAGLAALSEHQRHTLAETLSDVARMMSNAHAHPPMFFEEGRRKRTRIGTARKRRSG
jgi:DNA-binding MarR family transcriptional regulator